MLSWYSLLAFSAWTWLFLALHCIHNFKHLKKLQRAFLFPSGLSFAAFSPSSVSIPTKPSHLSCTLAHSCCHFPAFPDFPLCLSPLLSDSNCNLFLCNSELQDLSVSFSLIVTVYWYLIDIYCLFHHESDFYCWIHLVWGMHSTKACTTAHSLDTENDTENHEVSTSFVRTCDTPKPMVDPPSFQCSKLRRFEPFEEIDVFSRSNSFRSSFPLACLPGHHQQISTSLTPFCHASARLHLY